MYKGVGGQSCNPWESPHLRYIIVPETVEAKIEPEASTEELEEPEVQDTSVKRGRPKRGIEQGDSDSKDISARPE